jgi:hypothetical protein
VLCRIEAGIDSDEDDVEAVAEEIGKRLDIGHFKELASLP